MIRMMQAFMGNKAGGRSGLVPPSIEEIVSDPTYRAWVDRLSRPLVTALVREVVAELRGEPGANRSTLAEQVRQRLDRWQRQAQTPVINATGVLIHTNLGRAPLDGAFWDEVSRSITHYHTLEFDLESGQRGKRGPLVNRLLAELAGAEAGLVVNNCAAAVLLMLCLARGRKVLVSRGELVQIGGGFRIPEIMAQSGAKLVEVGTTNRTALADYERAIDTETAAVLKVHRSNFSMSGFVEDAASRELSTLCRTHRLQLFEDLGSGAVTDLSIYGLPRERTIVEAIRDGADLVSFSGDKLLGGPQAGCLVGKKDAIVALSQHPLYRAVRPGKISLAALDVCLRAHLDGRSEQILPLYRLLATSRSELRKRAEAICSSLPKLALTACDSEAVTGGGTLPDAQVPSVAVVLKPSSPDQFVARLRARRLPVLARVQDDRVYLDLKTVFPDQDTELAHAVADAFTN
jgi:L-seryl-tRNA(Ser) seleniumtransferase